MRHLAVIFPLLAQSANQPSPIRSLSWCDTTASFVGRLYGAYTPPLPQSLRIPLTTRTIPLPLARRKSLAGFIAAAVTGCLIGITFWGWVAPMGAETPSWTWRSSDGWMGYLGLAAVGIVTGLISSVAESLGTSHHMTPCYDANYSTS